VAFLAPSDLVATPVSRNGIRLDWIDNSTDELGFQIHRKGLGEASYRFLAVVGADVKTFLDTDLTMGSTYYYIVRAYK